MNPEDLFATFADQALTVAPWVVAAIAAGIGLYFALVGIGKGLAWFFAIVQDRDGKRLDAAAGRDWDAQVAEHWTTIRARLRDDGYGAMADALDADPESRGVLVGGYLYAREGGASFSESIAEGFEGLAGHTRRKAAGLSG